MPGIPQGSASVSRSSMVTGHILLEVPAPFRRHSWFCLSCTQGTQGSVRSQKQGPKTDPGEIKHKKHPFCEAGPHFIGWAPMIRENALTPVHYHCQKSGRIASQRNWRLCSIPFPGRLGASKDAGTGPGSEHIFMHYLLRGGHWVSTCDESDSARNSGAGTHSSISVTLCPDRPGRGGRSWGLHPYTPLLPGITLQSPAPSGSPACTPQGRETLCRRTARLRLYGKSYFTPPMLIPI